MLLSYTGRAAQGVQERQLLRRGAPGQVWRRRLHDRRDRVDAVWPCGKPGARRGVPLLHGQRPVSFDLVLCRWCCDFLYTTVRGVAGSYEQKSGLICDSWEMVVWNSTCMLFLASNLFNTHPKSTLELLRSFFDWHPHFCRGGRGLDYFIFPVEKVVMNKPNNVTTMANHP